MSDFADNKALEIAKLVATDHEIVDPQIIALIQLGAIAGIESVFHPYEPFEYLVTSNLNVQNLIGIILNSDLPMQRWGAGNDESGIKITLARQRKHISDTVKESIIEGYLKVDLDDTLTTKVGIALKSARGWLQTCISSPKAQLDLKLIDETLDVVETKIKCTCLSESQNDAYEPGGPMSGHQKPPPCQALVHKH